MLCCDVWTMWGIHHDDLSSHYPVTSHSPPHSRVPTTPQPPNRETQQPLNYDNNVTAAIIWEHRGQQHYTTTQLLVGEKRSIFAHTQFICLENI